MIMKKVIPILLMLIFQTSLYAQMPPPPVLQPGENWTQLWSVYYDYQSNGSVRYIQQDPSNPNAWCAIMMAQHDSNGTSTDQRYIYYSYTENNGNSWFSGTLDMSSNFGFPCITLSNGIPVIACHKSSSTGSFVYKDLIFGGLTFAQITGVPLPTGSGVPIWPHIAGTSNGNLVMAGSPNDGSGLIGARTTYNGSWSPYQLMNSINGPSGNFDVAAGPNGAVSIFGTDYNLTNYLYWYKSTDNGITFDNGNEILNFLYDEDDQIFANTFGGYQSVYDNSGNVHLLFTAYNYDENAIFPNAHTLKFIKPGIYHWSSLTNVFTKVAGKTNIPELTDTITQFGMVPIGHPTVTYTSGGKLICAFTAYLRGNTQIVDNGDEVNAGEIFYTVSDDNGVTWSVPQNITNTPGIEEKHPSLSSKTSDDSLRVFYVRDMKAGACISVTEWGKAPVYGIFNNFNFNQIPIVPVLLSPPNNSINTLLTLQLDWNNLINAESYNVQLSEDSTFSSLLINQNVSTSEYTVPSSVLNYNTKYFWRVNAVNNNGTGDWSSVWNFRTVTLLPPPPALLSPQNGEVGVTLTPNLIWNSSPSADSYNFQLAADSNFSSPLINQINIISTQFQVPPILLSYNTKYFWRVSSSNSNGTGLWSATSNFTTYSLPAAPLLFTPENGSTGVQLVVLFNWNDVPNSIRYRIRASADSTFTSNILDDSTITISQYTTSPTTFVHNTKYYWKVNAINNAGNGEWSETWNFTTAQGILPSAPILISPALGSSNIILTPQLLWENVSGANTYRVQISVDLNFNTIIFDQPNLNQTQIIVPPPILGYNTLYFWRVNAKNAIGEGSWSQIWNFRTRLQTGINLISDLIPEKYNLFSNYPNPFNPSTKIKFDLPKSGFTSISIFDISGREITGLINENLNAGSYEVEFSADKFNLSSGIYFYKIESGGFVETKRMVLIK